MKQLLQQSPLDLVRAQKPSLMATPALTNKTCMLEEKKAAGSGKQSGGGRMWWRRIHFAEEGGDGADETPREGVHPLQLLGVGAAMHQLKAAGVGGLVGHGKGRRYSSLVRLNKCFGEVAVVVDAGPTTVSAPSSSSSSLSLSLCTPPSFLYRRRSMLAPPLPYMPRSTAKQTEVVGISTLLVRILTTGGQKSRAIDDGGRLPPAAYLLIAERRRGEQGLPAGVFCGELTGCYLNRILGKSMCVNKKAQEAKLLWRS
ncbi:hypothetical protein MUK42_17807 [Musa troglodytarum]|uniref:Uncharacterized protein n=1 Tax=Musa troglodytarum TaxID=320322 RepID=A0A9E7ETM0_9LILI|nr:hypothetical protein MUK42_17807 [Musa troglodytarum]